MKILKLLLVCFVIALGQVDLFAQEKSFNIENDSVLKRIKSELPSNWETYVENGVLHFTNKLVAVGVLNKKTQEKDSGLNIPPPLPDTITQKILIYLTDVRPIISVEDRQIVILRNKEIDSLIDILPEKFNHIKEPRGKRGSKPMYIFENDSIRNQYSQELYELRKMKVFVPYYFSELYCYTWKKSPLMYSDYRWQPIAIEKEVKIVNDLLTRFLGEYD